MALFWWGCCIGRRLDEHNISESDRLAIDRTSAIKPLPRPGAA